MLRLANHYLFEPFLFCAQLLHHCDKYYRCLDLDNPFEMSEASHTFSTFKSVSEQAAAILPQKSACLVMVRCGQRPNPCPSRYNCHNLFGFALCDRDQCPTALLQIKLKCLHDQSLTLGFVGSFDQPAWCIVQKHFISRQRSASFFPVFAAVPRIWRWFLVHDSCLSIQRASCCGSVLWSE